MFAVCAAAIASSYFIFKKKFAPAASERTLNVSDLETDLEAGQLKSAEAEKLEVSSTIRDSNKSTANGQNSADDDSESPSLDSENSNSEPGSSEEEDTKTEKRSSPLEIDSNNELQSDASETDSESDAELKAKVVSTYNIFVDILKRWSSDGSLFLHRLRVRFYEQSLREQWYQIERC